MQKRDDLYLWRKGNTQSFDLCVPTFDAFVKINGAKANSLGRLFVWPHLILVRGRKLVLQ
jgi:hypothetical protein